ncbi:MAG: NUDIX domain-containing protein [Patescibacteria group bacterium]
MYEKYPLVLAVASFIVDTRNRILIVEKSLHEKIDPGLWTVPGGKVMPHEHIISALKREVKEEVGLEIVSYTWIGEDVFMSDKTYFHGEHFLCKAKKTAPVKLEKNLVDFAWIYKEDISKYSFHPNIKKRLLSLYEI